MKYYGEMNGSLDKTECCRNRKTTSALDSPEVPVPAPKNGFYWTGLQPDGHYLVMFDFDTRKGVVMQVENLPPILQETEIHRACRGGLHALAITDYPCGNTGAKYRDPDDKNIVLDEDLAERHKGLVGFDLRGNGGKCIAAGSRFDTSNGEPYRGGTCEVLQSDDEPVFLVRAEIEAIVRDYCVSNDPSKKRSMTGHRVSGKLDIPGYDGEPFEVVNDEYPPCMNRILSKAENGRHLHHEERVNLADFLACKEVPENEIVDAFRNVPDFNENKTLYQVRYAIKGKNGHPFNPKNCDKLSMENICPYSCGARNPLGYKPGAKMATAGMEIETFNGAWPSCMNLILGKLSVGAELCPKEGMNLERFLNWKGNSADNIVDFYSRQPSFDEEKVRDRVIHDIDRNYKPERCWRLRAEGLCPRPCGASNPIDFRR
jgi:hypothetical protein